MNVEIEYIKDLSTKLNLDLLEYCDQLTMKDKTVMSNQLLHSGLEIGKLFSEAHSSQSNLGLSHKLNGILSSLNTIDYGLNLCQNSIGYPSTSHLTRQIAHLKREISTLELMNS